MKEVKFKELFDYQKKSKIKAGDGLSLSEGKYPFFTSSNTLSKSLNEFLFTKTSLIFGTGGVPSIHFCETEFAVSTDCLVAQPKADVEIFVKYFYYFFIQNDLRVLADGFKGAGLKHISRKYIDEIKIPLPPLTTQKRIASILDNAAALRDKTQQLLDEYDQLAQSIFLEMFGDPAINPREWNMKILSKYSNRIVVGHVGPTSSGYSEKGVPFLRTQNVRPNFIDKRQVQMISYDFHSKLKKSKIFGGDVLISRVGVNRGMAAVVPLEFDEANCANVIVVGKTDLLNPLFLSFFLNSSFGKKPEYGYSVGSAQGVVNTSIVKKWPIYDVDLSLQNQFADKIRLIEQQKALAKQELQQSENLFNCLLQKAFKGELV